MYLTGIVILFVAGMVIQYVYFKEETKEEKVFEALIFFEEDPDASLP